MGNIDAPQDRGDKIASLSSRLANEIKLWGAEKLDQALVQPASRAIEKTAKAIQDTHESAVNGVVAAAEATRDVKNSAIDKTVRVTRGTIAVAEKARDVAADATSRHIIEPTADAGKAIARSANKKYEGAVATASRAIENTVDTGKRGVKAVKDTHESVVSGVVATAETTRDVKNKMVDKTVRFAKGASAVAEYAGDQAAKTVNKVHSVAIDATSRHIIEPTADAGKAIARSANKKYEGAVTTTSRVIGNTVDTGKQVANAVKTKHENVVKKVVGVAEDVRDVTNGVVAVVDNAVETTAMVYDRGANPEKYQQVTSVEKKPKTKVADKPSKSSSKANAG